MKEAMTAEEREQRAVRKEANSRKRLIESYGRDLQQIKLKIGDMQIEICRLTRKASSIKEKIDSLNEGRYV